MARTPMKRVSIQTVCVALVLWNLFFAIFWIGFSEAAVLTRTSDKYGHIQDADERWQRMKAEIDASLAGARPYYAYLLVLAGVNIALAILIGQRDSASRAHELA